MASPSPDPGSSASSPPHALRSPALATLVKPYPTSDLRPSDEPAPRLSAAFTPALSALAAPSPTGCGSSRTYVLSFPAPRSPAPVAPYSTLPASALRPFVAPVTDPCDLRPPHNWGDVLAPPPLPSASVTVRGASLDLVTITPWVGDACSST